jgi:hypothetical protein
MPSIDRINVLVNNKPISSAVTVLTPVPASRSSTKCWGGHASFTRYKNIIYNTNKKIINSSYIIQSSLYNNYVQIEFAIIIVLAMAQLLVVLTVETEMRIHHFNRKCAPRGFRLLTLIIHRPSRRNTTCTTKGDGILQQNDILARWATQNREGGYKTNNIISKLTYRVHKITVFIGSDLSFTICFSTGM